MPEKRKGHINISEDRLRGELAIQKLEIFERIQESENRNRTRHEELLAMMAGIPDMVRAHEESLKNLSWRDWWTTGLGSMLAFILALVFGKRID